MIFFGPWCVTEELALFFCWIFIIPLHTLIPEGGNPYLFLLHLVYNRLCSNRMLAVFFLHDRKPRTYRILRCMYVFNCIASCLFSLLPLSMGSVRYRATDGLFSSYLSKQDKRDGMDGLWHGKNGRKAGWLVAMICLHFPLSGCTLLLLLLVCVFSCLLSFARWERNESYFTQVDATLLCCFCFLCCACCV